MKGNYNMNTTNFKETMKIFFDELGIDPIDFEYDNELNYFISVTSFINSEDDPQEYYIVVKIVHDCGTVVVGYTDGIQFYELKTLGQIVFEDGKWNIF